MSSCGRCAWAGHLGTARDVPAVEWWLDRLHGPPARELTGGYLVQLLAGEIEGCPGLEFPGPFPQRVAADVLEQLEASGEIRRTRPAPTAAQRYLGSGGQFNVSGPGAPPECWAWRSG